MSDRSAIRDARIITKALGGRWCGSYGIARCPVHDDRDPSLSIRDGEQELIVNCFAGCAWQDVKAELARQGLLPKLDAEIPPSRSAASRQVVGGTDQDEAKKLKRAEHIWRTAIPLAGTLGWKYFTERRGLHIGLLDDLSHSLRWHEGEKAVIALMTDPVTNKPTGIHRTFLNADGTKRERKMLGAQGVIRLSRDGEVTLGLGISEGIEDALAILLTGWVPMWAATSAGAIERFPVLSGIEALTIFADTDAAGMKAARVCAARWAKAGREARLSPSKELTDAA